MRWVCALTRAASYPHIHGVGGDFFLDWLEGVRHVADMPMIINDATRTPERQARHSGRRTGPHVDGIEVDVKVHGEGAER